MTDAERMANTLNSLKRSGFSLGADGVWRGQNYDIAITDEPTYDGAAFITSWTANEAARKKWAAERRSAA